jgi:hypothetical protein
VPVPQAPNSVATVVEIKGFLLFGDVRGVIDTSSRLEQGDDLCSVDILNRHRVRGVVPPGYTHVKVVPMTSSRSRNGLHWWRLGFRTADTCAEFTGTLGGKHDDVFQYPGPAVSCHLEVGDKGYVAIEHYSFDGTRRDILTHASGAYRGRFELPGPGLVQVRCSGTWSATVGV